MPDQIILPAVAALEIAVAEPQSDFQTAFTLDAAETTADPLLPELAIPTDVAEPSEVTVDEESTLGSDASIAKVDTVDAEAAIGKILNQEPTLPTVTVVKPSTSVDPDTIVVAPVTMPHINETFPKRIKVEQDDRSANDALPRHHQRTDAPSLMAKPNPQTEMIVGTPAPRGKAELEVEHTERRFEPGPTGAFALPKTAHVANAVGEPLKPTKSGLIIRAVSALEWSSLTKGEATSSADSAPITGGVERFATTVSTAGASGTTTEAARPVMQQISAAVISARGNTIEVALNPEELGRVRLQISGVDGGLSLQLMSERPETMELLKRHIDLLAQDLEKLGYETLSFSFEQEGQTEREHHDGLTDFHALTDEDVTDQASRTVSQLQAVGLDLRL
ncbi:flagellar hook-length control protein FliK [Yoonia sp. 2307UL14-13]|uniref:flagellar hook-length control protein FliK n=1 Tax=Yoonia sp. 2307UL14-13 TaxID=3126506 RepID=UPI0030B06975